LWFIDDGGAGVFAVGVEQLAGETDIVIIPQTITGEVVDVFYADGNRGRGGAEQGERAQEESRER
jgi:hypothetical protein